MRAENLYVEGTWPVMNPPPRVAVLAGLAEMTCTPAQHIWLRIPTSWRCQCGEMVICDTPPPSSRAIEHRYATD